jgi:uncharacterized protein
VSGGNPPTGAAEPGSLNDRTSSKSRRLHAGYAQHDHLTIYTSIPPPDWRRAETGNKIEGGRTGEIRHPPNLDATMTSAHNTANADAGPVTPEHRIEALDTLRGFALLGILVMNITGMAFPFAAYFDPMAYGGQTGANYAAWVFARLFFDLKFLGIFSMLFGAGLLLMAERAEATGRPFARIHYRRIFWLLVFGLVHAYLIWHGDILVTYALCGIFLFLFRRRSARGLIVSGVAVLLFGALLSTGGGFAQAQLRDVVEDIEASVAAGEEMTPQRQRLVDQWEDLRRSFKPTPQEVDETIEIMRGSVREVLKETAKESISMHTQAVPFMLFWRALALMLIGMGLMKAGVFSAQRSSRFYRNWMIVGFGLGLPIIAFGIWRWSLHEYDFIDSFLVDSHYNYFASVLVSMAYVGLVMLLCQSGKLPGLRKRLAAVGRMALTNYLMQSLIAVSLFYGYGLALFGQIGRFNLWWFILGIWAVQLLLSPWWLDRFRFGPAEWLWRTLTYLRMQPMRIERQQE